MKSAILVLPLCGLCFSEPSIGQGGRKRIDSTTHHLRPPIQVMLRTPIEHVSWDDAPFTEVLEWVRSKSDKNNPFNIIVRWRALEISGVDPQTTVTLALEQVTVAQVLDEVLGQISGADPLLYVSKGNLLRFTTKSDLRRELYTRTYDVGEIVMKSRGLRVKPKFFSGRQLDFGVATATPAAGIGGSSETLNIGAFLFGDPSEDDDDSDDVTDDELAERIMEAIVKTVAPESWRVNGGRGSLSFINGLLIVRNSADVHQLIGGPFRLND